MTSRQWSSEQFDDERSDQVDDLFQHKHRHGISGRALQEVLARRWWRRRRWVSRTRAKMARVERE